MIRRTLASYSLQYSTFIKSTSIHILIHSLPLQYKKMEIIELKPPNHLHFKIPSILTSTSTITNLTLKPIYVFLVPAHPQHLSIHPHKFFLQPFQENTIETNLHWNQQLIHPHKSKVRIYAWQLYDQQPNQQVIMNMFKRQQYECTMYEELLVEIYLDKNYLRRLKTAQPIHNCLIQRIILPNNSHTSVNEETRKNLFQYCEKLGRVRAISEFNGSYVVEFFNVFEPICSFFEGTDSDGNILLFSITQIYQIGITTNTPDIIMIEDSNTSKQFTNSLENSSTSESLPANHKYSNDSLKKSFITNPSKKRKSKSLAIENFQSFEIQKWKQPKYPPKKQFYEVSIETTKTILNIVLSGDGKTVYALLRDCLMVCPFQDLSSKKIIKFSPLNESHSRIPMIVSGKDVIFGSDCYLYWINAEKDEITWKYVQRKTIYSLCSIEELAFVVVGGKTHSKLAYLGKTTSKTTLKLYSNGQNDKHTHLHTFEMANFQSESVIELKYVKAKPNINFLLGLTDHGKMFFLRVKAYNNIQPFSIINIHQIGIQSIVSMEYHPQSKLLVLLEQLTPTKSCFKILKIKSSYGRVELATQSIGMGADDYGEEFKIGQNCIVAIEKQNNFKNISKISLKSKEKRRVMKGKDIRKCLISGDNIVCQEETGLKFHLEK